MRTAVHPRPALMCLERGGMGTHPLPPDSVQLVLLVGQPASPPSPRLQLGKRRRKQETQRWVIQSLPAVHMDPQVPDLQG